ncbi:MAG: hypothetical protein JNK48_05125 [Bryobacterales bacterium]|nr:hypothetical protein [Bryobacterales bacterium]
MRRIQFLLALVLVTILTVAGPCPACPMPQAEKSAHDCCPGGKTTKKAPSQDDCPLVAYYLDVTKHGKNAQGLTALLAEAPMAPAVALAAADGGEVFAGAAGVVASGRYSYLRHGVLLI